MQIRNLIIPFFLILAGACVGSHPDPLADIQPDSVHVSEVYRIMHEYGRIDSTKRQALIDSDSIEVAAFMAVVADSPITPDKLLGWSWSLPVQVFTPDVDSVFVHSGNELSKTIGTVTARLRASGIDVPQRRYATVAWGRHESMMFVDSVMLIALNHYLGATYKGYSSFPLYMQLVKEQRFIPYDIAEAITATRYPYQPTEAPTALSRMLYEGAIVTVRKAAVPGASEQDALAYLPEQLNYLKDEEAALWQKIVSDGLLYDTSPATTDRLVLPAPNTTLLSPGCPGRAGRYIGWRIVESYLKRHPGTTLDKILSPSFYNSSNTLAEAGYRP